MGYSGFVVPKALVSTPCTRFQQWGMNVVKVCEFVYTLNLDAVCHAIIVATSREAKPVQEPPSRRPHQVPRPDPPDHRLLGRPGVVPVRPRHASRRQLPQLPHHHPQDGQPLRGGLRLHPPRLHGHAVSRLPGRMLALHHQDGVGLQGRYLFIYIAISSLPIIAVGQCRDTIKQYSPYPRSSNLQVQPILRDSAGYINNIPLYPRAVNLQVSLAFDVDRPDTINNIPLYPEQLILRFGLIACFDSPDTIKQYAPLSKSQ
ncbi:hypothetical protein HNY73_008434 [Argiope bruennichi]|uniref:Uncharacterized protein n=1 Tax=Argiope bruennichi TaxID=94029 RepID=A0A8T0F7C8_ARGBR|nr:hypothetical protein HNY73_008434 [Argiope bruennichi]